MGDSEAVVGGDRLPLERTAELGDSEARRPGQYDIGFRIVADAGDCDGGKSANGDQRARKSADKDRPPISEDLDGVVVDDRDVPVVDRHVCWRLGAWLDLRGFVIGGFLVIGAAGPLVRGPPGALVEEQRPFLVSGVVGPFLMLGYLACLAMGGDFVTGFLVRVVGFAGIVVFLTMGVVFRSGAFA